MANRSLTFLRTRSFRHTRHRGSRWNPLCGANSDRLHDLVDRGGERLGQRHDSSPRSDEDAPVVVASVLVFQGERLWRIRKASVVRRIIAVLPWTYGSPMLTTGLRIHPDRPNSFLAESRRRRAARYCSAGGTTVAESDRPGGVMAERLETPGKVGRPAGGRWASRRYLRNWSLASRAS